MMEKNLEDCLSNEDAVMIKDTSKSIQRTADKNQSTMCLYDYDCDNKYRKSGFVYCMGEPK